MPGRSLDPQADASVHPIVRKTAAWSWRFLVILAALGALLWLAMHLEVIVVPVLLATMVTAMLLPLVDVLDRRGLPRGAAVAAVMLISIVVVGGMLTFVVSQFIQGAPALIDQVALTITNARNSLSSGLLAHFSNAQIKSATDAAIGALKDNQAKLTSGALSTAGTITEIVTGALLMLFTLIFLLQGGRTIFAFITKVFPVDVRDRVRDAGRAGFHSLTGYVRATFLVALTDAIGIGTGLAIMGIPLALPLASLVFLGAFIPLIGAVIAGGLAVIVALIAKGWVFALITLGLIVAVQQLESHVLQPLVMGRAVSLHPLAVVLAIAAGGVSAGIVGALLAVPLVAVLNSSLRVLLASDPDAEEQALDDDTGPPISSGTTDDIEAIDAERRG
ncbi:AI-2E family transporter [Mycolicibacterium madagascariense]|uniref:AI-2E family transporter n=1 Tax=Mycolicibacterium madagascariense TaxID=212765 RepID=A0A7I7XA14_9MYCO|nr:AI-2E family transporter [Mycolicibacterium madagascariense]MCV7012941.1 AI-2E family transporter [Mycolicibacterium madagascariense]BBZ26190.1 AI-2E family transporter [Mycolicibacterium madagascariense]